MTRNLPVAFLRARLMALFLLSLASVYGVTVGLSPKLLLEPYSMAWPPVALAAATLAGAALMDRLLVFVDRAGRARLQLLGWGTYSSMLLLVVAGIVAGERGQQAVRTGAGAMRLVQIAFLLLAGLGRGYIGAIVNAFAMTCVAALAGGAAAAMALTFHAAFLVFFLVADHHARLLTDYPVDALPAAGPILRRAFGSAASIAVVLSVFFAFEPCAPCERLLGRSAGASTPLPPEQVLALVRDLVLIMALAATAFWLLLWVGGGRGRESAAVLSEKIAARRTTAPPAASAPPPEVPDLEGWRARIVKLYLRLTERLSRLGVRRRASQTPREFARALAPGVAAESLTEIFVRARYGDREVSEEDFNAASAASTEILAHFRERR